MAFVAAKKSILALVENLIQKAHSAHKAPVVVFDLDGTLFDVAPRTTEIVRRFVAQPSITERFPRECGIAGDINPSHVKYSLEQTLNHLGIVKDSEHSAQFLHLAETFWFKHFFTDELLAYDTAYESAVDCVKWFQKQGCHIVYLSGRDVPNMSQGTISSMEKFGIPHGGHGVSMMLKPSYGMDDLLFKHQSVASIQAIGPVVATFDNEPANVAMFLKEFPEGMSFHFNTPFARWIELTGAHYRQLHQFSDLLVSE